MLRQPIAPPSKKRPSLIEGCLTFAFDLAFNLCNLATCVTWPLLISPLQGRPVVRGLRLVVRIL